MAAIERKPYMDRIDRLKQRVLKTKPEMDLDSRCASGKHMHLRNSAWRKL